MKKLFYLAAICVLTAALSLSGCKKENSALNIDDITTYAKITGSIWCPWGNPRGGDDSLRLVTEGPKIYVEVPNDQYTGNGKGSTVFQTTVAGNGTYEIQIPVPVGKTIKKVTLYGEPFTANYSKSSTPTTYISVSRVFTLASRSISGDFSPNNTVVQSFAYDKSDIYARPKLEN